MSDPFAHQLRIDQIHDGARIDIIADDGERAAVARRLGLQSLERLDAHVVMARDGMTVRAEGRLLAALDQACVISGEPVAAAIDEPFAVRFIPEPSDIAPDEEIELGAADCDTVFHDGATIDLGSAIADSLALSLDPYPRSAGAGAVLKEAGVISEAEAGPFAALAKLKRDDDQ